MCRCWFCLCWSGIGAALTLKACTSPELWSTSGPQSAGDSASQGVFGNVCHCWSPCKLRLCWTNPGHSQFSVMFKGEEWEVFNSSEMDLGLSLTWALLFPTGQAWRTRAPRPGGSQRIAGGCCSEGFHPLNPLHCSQGAFLEQMGFFTDANI